MEKLEQYLKYLVTYLKQKSNSFNGYILGLSGGLDSAVVSLLAKEAVGDKLLVVTINIHSSEEDLKHARNLALRHKLNFLELDLSAEYDALIKALEAKEPLTDISKINTKVRLRMTTLYALGQTEGKLVLGTDNMAELYTGYFTKWGDGAADILVLSSLTKSEVSEAARILGVTEEIINKAPTAGLYMGQTDEQEMGITYADLDAYLLGEEVYPQIAKKALYLHKVSEHKRRPIPRPKEFKR